VQYQKLIINPFHKIIRSKLKQYLEQQVLREMYSYSLTVTVPASDDAAMGAVFCCLGFFRAGVLNIGKRFCDILT